ncbi:MAG: hypothetical protein RL742_76 [Bacteroidota bacterium]
MTSLPTLLVSFALIGLLLAALTKWAGKTDKPIMTFLQHFAGVWFVFSGIVKAIDPIGTAYKMEDYFAAFETTFGGLQNAFSGLAPLFPYLAQYSAGFSIFMIVLEIALGVMLMLGYAKRVTAILFFLIVVFFTVLTGFTYLTGFVPMESNFFDFSKWGPYIATQMRVTDCGCFGDFIKLDPKISFFKDIGLMIPAIYFLLRSRDMHQLFTERGRAAFNGLATVGALLFCIQNTYWDLPVVDFRPFKVGANIREQKTLEEEARSNVEIIGWVMENTQTGKVEKAMIPMERYKELMEKYPKDKGWKVKDQIKTEPFIEKDGQRVVVKETKVSDFAIEDNNNTEVTEELLNEPGYSMMIVAYKLYDSPEYAQLFKEKVNRLAASAQKDGWKVYAMVTYADAPKAEAFRSKIGAEYPFYHGDDKLLKTIIRANPGVVVLKDGKVMANYHQRHLPETLK